MKKWRRLLHEWDPPGEGSDDEGALHGRKRGRDKPCSPDENAAPKRQTLSGGCDDGDLYGGMLIGWLTRDFALHTDWDEDEVQC